MKKLIVAAALVTGFAGAAIAQDAVDPAAPADPAADLTLVDTDMSGDVSFEEAVVVWPDLTQEDFDAADADVSGTLSADEYAALTAAAGAPAG